jgi:hypothetical protein
MSWGSNEYNGELSRATRSKIVKMINVWAESIYVSHTSCLPDKTKSDLRLRFLTLTLPSTQHLLDNEIKRVLLTPFIELLKRKYGLKHYFWRAEAQRNGNIHFHLVIDCFVPKNEVNFYWDSLCFGSGFQIAEPVLTKDYKTPSTRIEAIQGVSAVAGYVVKYVCKSEGGRKINGRIWGCSDGLRSMSMPVIAYTNDVAVEIDRVSQTKKYEIKTNEYSCVHKVSILRSHLFFDSWIRTELELMYKTNYEILYPIDIWKMKEPMPLTIAQLLHI